MIRRKGRVMVVKFFYWNDHKLPVETRKVHTERKLCQVWAPSPPKKRRTVA